MFFKKSNRTQNTIDTLVGADTKIEGNISFSGGLRVDGTVLGAITEPNDTPSTLILSEHGRIEGSVTVAKVVINGSVTGPVRSAQFIELQTKARIIGDVYYNSLEIHTGAVIEGKLVYLGDTQNNS
ncbi:MAG: cell shape determination protein CcmA [Methylotenera sp. 24-45-7]|nr:MAG: cell shape determination protein CcmA [Mehylophilales bacterium 35-46-6]OYY82312.1 MAG: cell shape determination protein CcmA [Methylophilales bacterium 16-45-9]OYZ40364.1 MAG: cell shape determination protein CcmA [Methylotenera sp. 24-45-7]OZA07987.1 MAG: cell shape determination protein CcmA [Methylotenera sp. 17-45-7]OZA49303.1 MAG: cell shape determination protein CcmA [Methylophilales bacterium 39-45-7]HQS38123.1 polymer-forming cytoskeletal protein [Methylotenera sp.]